jgi:PTS system nitrogen regulatory IIA component
MQLADLLSPARVAAGVRAPTKAAVLQTMGELLGADHRELDCACIARALAEREATGSTGLGEGLALPHGRLPGLPAPLAAFARLDAELDYDALDRKPVRYVLAVLVPAEQPELHLQILALIAAAYHDKTWRAQLAEAKTAEELYNCLTRARPA